MTNKKAMYWLERMRGKPVNYAQLIGSVQSYGTYGVYTEPEDYALTVAINALEQQDKERWIHINERYPTIEEYLKDDGRFIVSDGNRVYESNFDRYDCMKFCKIGIGALGYPYKDEDKCVTAWKPMPEVYKENSKIEDNL